MSEQQLSPNANPLKLIVSRSQQLTSRMWVCELRDEDGGELPLVTAGSYIGLPVSQDDTRSVIINYPICSDPFERRFYTVAIPTSANDISINRPLFTDGSRLNCQIPTKHFLLHADASPAVLIADDIGISVIKTIAQTLVLRGRRFGFHYTGPSREEMPFIGELEENFKRHLHIYTADEKKHLDFNHVLSEAPSNAFVYIAGSQAFIEQANTAMQSLRIPKDCVQSNIVIAEPAKKDRSVILELARSNKLINVGADQPLLAALREAGANVKFNCCVGDCGTCALRVIEGVPDHRDNVLSEADKKMGLMCVCVSRANSEKLVLDL